MDAPTDRGELDHRRRVIAAAWFSSRTVDEIGCELGLAKSTVSRIAKQMGLPPRGRRATAVEINRFVRLYGSGLSIAQVAQSTGWHRDTVQKALLAAGVKIASPGERSRKWPVDHSAFSPPLTPEGWYWVGLLAADGNVSGPRVSLGLKRSDAPLLRRYLAYVGAPERPLRASGAEGKAYYADLSSAQIVGDLMRHGIVPRKTYSLRTSDEAAVQAPFWLGELDGDGSICFSKEGVPTILFVGTQALMNQCAAFLDLHALGRRPSVHLAGGNQDILWETKVMGDSARQVAHVLLNAFPDSLERKRRRLERASGYESQTTRARLATRRRPCDWCGAWVERMPSQFHDHVFCNSRHFGLWNAAVRKAGALAEGS